MNFSHLGLVSFEYATGGFWENTALIKKEGEFGWPGWFELRARDFAQALRALTSLVMIDVVWLEEKRSGEVWVGKSGV